MLEIRNLKVAYGKNEVLHGVNLSLQKDEIIGIVGESGSGKSTILHAILGILGSDAHISEGEILFQDRDLLKCPEKEFLRIIGKDISFVFQHPSLAFDPITKIGSQMYETVQVYENISRKEAEARFLTLLENMGFEHPERIPDSYPFELSGGMCQRVAIAIAMMGSPKILLADEPTSALDVTVQAQVIETLLELKNQYHMSIILVTHNMGIVSYLADRVYVMYQGNIVEHGGKKEVIRNPQHNYTKSLIRSVPEIPEYRAEE